MKRLLPFLLLALSWTACSSGADHARDVESQVWSPYCPGRLLADCPTQQARELRAEIGEQIDRGQSEAQVLAWVREEYGDQAVAQPEASGAGLVVWLAPAAFFAIGALVVWRFVSRNVEHPQTQEESHADP